MEIEHMMLRRAGQFTIFLLIVMAIVFLNFALKPGGADLPGTVLPHILRSVALLGIDSVMAPHARRERAWQTLAQTLDAAHLAEMTRLEPMSALPTLADDILAGKIRGRVVVDVTT